MLQNVAGSFALVRSKSAHYGKAGLFWARGYTYIGRSRSTNEANEKGKRRREIASHKQNLT